MLRAIPVSDQSVLCVLRLVVARSELHVTNSERELHDDLHDSALAKG